MTTEILERDLVGLIRDNLVDVVAALAVRQDWAEHTWKVSLTKVDGSEVVLRTGLTKDWAERMAGEASICILTLRTGREYPDDRIGPPAPERFYTVYWRLRNAVPGGRRASAGRWHLTRPYSPMTACGLTIPTSCDYEVHDARAARVYTGVLPACEVCTKIRDGGTARTVRP